MLSSPCWDGCEGSELVGLAPEPLDDDPVILPEGSSTPVGVAAFAGVVEPLGLPLSPSCPPFPVCAENSAELVPETKLAPLALMTGTSTEDEADPAEPLGAPEP